MRILFLAQVPPYPLDSGPQIRNHHILASLARRHRVTLVTFVRSKSEARSAQCLERLGVRVVTVPLKRSRLLDLAYFADALVTRSPFLVRRDYSRSMSATLREVLAGHRFDVMHIDQLTMAQYAGFGRDAGARVIVDEHNVVSDVLQRIIEASDGRWLRQVALKAELPKLESFERQACTAADLVFAVADRDRLLLLNSCRNARVITLPNVIDCQAVRLVPRPVSSVTLMTVGTLFYPPNADGIEWFIKWVLPLVARSIPNVRFVAAGARPPRRLHTLAANSPYVELPGYVADVAGLAAQAALMVVPIRVGGGARLKILNAFAMGIPVVSTSVGCEGIAVEPGCHLLVADTPEGFARQVVALVRNPELGDALAKSARSLVEDVYDSAQLDARLEAAYELLAVA